MSTRSRTVQYILTSRNEEACEDKLNLKEFKELEAGITFINEYLVANEILLPQNFGTNEKKELVSLSKGNTLIIVLSIQSLLKGNSINNLLNELRSVESINMEMIADFMYKNTIQQAISELENLNHFPKEILKVISLYEVPIDLYSISFLSDQNISSVEYVCQSLTSRLVLEKIGESYKPNEFANKFIITKYLPNKIEKKEIKQRIKEYQKKLEQKLKSFAEKKLRDPLLKGITNDWKPKNSIDTIAIAESFFLFRDTKNAVENDLGAEIEKIEHEFERIVKMTSHPYIKFQKARSFELMLKIHDDSNKRDQIKNEISKSFEEAIESTDFYYPYIKNTKSYASINWIYGLFISSYLNDYKLAARYIEDAIVIFKSLSINDKQYFTALNNLSWIYENIYTSSGDKRYLNELKIIYLEIIKKESDVRKLNFKFDVYKKSFAKYFHAPLKQKIKILKRSKNN